MKWLVCCFLLLVIFEGYQCKPCLADILKAIFHDDSDTQPVLQPIYIPMNQQPYGYNQYPFGYQYQHQQQPQMGYGMYRGY
ncbi:hypothetical protein B5X24_HaOG212570 [Helicoverpa armigera]|uniref:Uncharacterized protein n=1 Tax=Helicoverpa armigera TaxID=29058 RepID=A0A2W1B735_HELAM|nr:hypothetical protein B5X24_HaOG212570 [Helicoverpa armigera]